ncbi:exocyst complex component EXO70A1-like [Chenopodium quinoa]|uniref:Exocyst subunit Exo70 family protein n=1 Tax=Chenopodium quinoa TaxID=63459 RepID=A0A803M9R2_CHEQI|nr:exocyst complex component EXO70A1-like [Chenopodium quinoa]
MDKLLAARQCLKDSLEKSNSLASQIDETKSRLQKINGNLPLLSTELRSTYSRKSTFSAVGEHVDRAFGPVAAVLKIHESVCGLERSLMEGPLGGDITGYLLVVKQFEEALMFLSDNCGLAGQWMEDIVKLLDENVMADEKYILNVKRSLRVLSELKDMEAHARLNGGLLSNAFNTLELTFRNLVKENSSNNASFTELQVHKLQIIIERLKAHDRLENCMAIFVDVRSSNARAALQALNLSYLEEEISESDSIQKFEDHTVQWGKHLEFAVKHILQVEYDICKTVFEKFGSEISLGCFAKITVQSGFLELLKFGSRITEAKKDAIKLLKLLDIFAVLDNLRADFNMLFGSKACLEIQNLTRDLIKQVVEGACEIFKELSHQVEAQRYNMMPPSDGSVPRLVTFVTNYCVMLLEDNHKPILSKVLSIHQIWNKKKSHNGILRNEFQNILDSLEVNLETWSKTFEDTALSYFFLMNNYIYLYDFFKGTVFGDLMGEKLLHEHKRKMQIYAQAYLKHSWGKLPAILSEDELILFSLGTNTQELVKKRFRDFNEAFEDMYRKQSEWVVADNALRDKACQLIVHTIVPTYRSYVHNYSYLVENESSPSKYVKYSASSLEAMLSSLFQLNITKFGRSNSLKSNHLIGKLRNAVANQFRVAPIST